VSRLSSRLQNGTLSHQVEGGYQLSTINYQLRVVPIQTRSQWSRGDARLCCVFLKASWGTGRMEASSRVPEPHRVSPAAVVYTDNDSDYIPPNCLLKIYASLCCDTSANGFDFGARSQQFINCTRLLDPDAFSESPSQLMTDNLLQIIIAQGAVLHFRFKLPEISLRVWGALEQLLEQCDSELSIVQHSNDVTRSIAAILLRQINVYEGLASRRDYSTQCESKALRLLSIARDPANRWLELTQALPGDTHVAFGKDTCESPDVVNHVRSNRLC
jgi:hypothetical protein